MRKYRALHPTVSPVLALAAFAALASAQVPRGHVVISSTYSAEASSEPGGLFWVDPLAPSPPGTITKVTGLDCGLTGDTSSGCPPLFSPWEQGANCVLLRESDGALIAGEAGPPNEDIHLHVITLAGSAVQLDQQYFVGTTIATAEPLHAGIVQAQLLADGRVLVAVRNLVAAPPLDGRRLGIVDLSLPPTDPMAVVPVLMAGPPGFVNAVAVDGGTAYFTTTECDGGPCTSSLWSVDLEGTGPLVPPLLVASGLAGITSGLAVDCQGDVVASSLGAAPALRRIHPPTGAVTEVFPMIGELNSIAIERATGTYLVTAGSGSLYPGTYWRVTPAGEATQVTFTSLGQLGQKSGIALSPDPSPYGFATPGANEYGWDLCGTGLPTPGNPSFALQVTGLPALPPTGGILALSFAAASVPILGVHLFVDPFQFLGSPIPIAPSGKIALPIPAAVPHGVNVFGQAFYVESAAPLTVSSTQGLWISIL